MKKKLIYSCALALTTLAIVQLPKATQHTSLDTQQEQQIESTVPLTTVLDDTSRDEISQVSSEQTTSKQHNKEKNKELNKKVDSALLEKKEKDKEKEKEKNNDKKKVKTNEETSLTSKLKQDDTHSFDLSNIVGETKDGYIIQHGDHYHFVYKTLMPNLAQSVKSTVKSGVATTAASPKQTSMMPNNASDVWDDEEHITLDMRNVVKETETGYIVQHGDHYHFIYKTPLPSHQQVASVMNMKDSPIMSTSATHPITSNVHDDFDDDFDLEHVVEETETGYIVQHEDHYHFVPKKNQSTIITKEKEKEIKLSLLKKQYDLAPHLYKVLDDRIIYMGEGYYNVEMLNGTVSLSNIGHHEHGDEEPEYVDTSVGEATLDRMGIPELYKTSIIYSETTDHTLFPSNETDPTNMLAYIGKVTSLLLSEVPKQLDSTILNQFSSASVLSIDQSDMTSDDFKQLLKGSPNLYQIEELLLSETQITDLSFIDELPSLKRLSVSRQSLDTLPDLNHRQFEQISARYMSLTSPKLFESVKTQKLDLSYNDISDVSALNTTQMTELDISHNPIASLDGLSGNQTLEYLTLGFDEEQDLRVDTASVSLPHLKEFNAHHIGLTTLKDVPNLHAIETLNVSHNHIDSLEGVQNATQLTTLDVSNNAISTLDISEKNDTIEYLTVNGNQLVDLNGAEDYTKLYRLNVEENNITTLKTNQPSETLNYLFASDNQLTSWDGIEDYNALRRADVVIGNEMPEEVFNESTYE